MKWEKQYYDNVRGYSKYVCGDYTIKRTHNLNIFTGREMSAANQVWQIFRGDEKIGFKCTLREAKAFVEKGE